MFCNKKDVGYITQHVKNPKNLIYFNKYGPLES